MYLSGGGRIKLSTELINQHRVQDKSHLQYIHRGETSPILIRVASRFYLVKVFSLDQSASFDEQMRNLENYINGTERVRSILQQNPNPLHHKVDINGTWYEHQYHIVPVGYAQMSDQPREIFLINPNYISGPTLQDFTQARTPIGIQDVSSGAVAQCMFSENKGFFSKRGVLYFRDRSTDVVDDCDDLFNDISSKSGIACTLAEMNIKSKVDLDNGIFHSLITDIGAGILPATK